MLFFYVDENYFYLPKPIAKQKIYDLSKVIRNVILVKVNLNDGDSVCFGAHITVGAVQAIETKQ